MGINIIGEAMDSDLWVLIKKDQTINSLAFSQLTVNNSKLSQSVSCASRSNIHIYVQAFFSLEI